MSKKYVLVLGSKPNSTLPNIKVEKIYTANGAAEKAQRYLDRFPETSFTAVVGGREFEVVEEVKKRVIKSKPDTLLSRSGPINFQRYDFTKKTNYQFFTFKQALLFQSQFFKLNILDIFIKEFYYEEKFFNKIYHVLKKVKHGTLGGVSTGFFSILHALKFYPECDIIISGIGMSFGGHFYDTKNYKYNNRSKVDRALIVNLKKKYKDRLCTLDAELVEVANIKQWDGNSFNL